MGLSGFISFSQAGARTGPAHSRSKWVQGWAEEIVPESLTGVL